MINLGIIVGDQIGAIDTACISSTIALALLILLLKKKGLALYVSCGETGSD